MCYWASQLMVGTLDTMPIVYERRRLMAELGDDYDRSVCMRPFEEYAGSLHIHSLIPSKPIWTLHLWTNL